MQPVEYQPYSAYHVFEMVLVMAFCGFAFWQALARMVPHRGRTLDLDELYRRPSLLLAGAVSEWLDRTATALGAGFDRMRAATVEWVRDPTTWTAAPEGQEKPPFDENLRRRTVGGNLGLILGALVLLAGLLLLTGA